MAYAFTHPVTSPFSATHDVPVIISVDGKDEEFLELDLGMDIEWTVTEDAWSPSSLHKECEQRTALSHGWYQDDWGIKSHDHHQKPYIVLCLDTNVILSQLPLLRSVHHLVLTMYPAEPSPISFLIPFAVLRELDGLKSSTKLVQQSRIPGQPGTDRSTHAITVGYLAQRANRWLLDVKRAERTESIGIGLIRGDLELDRTIDPSVTNDDRILQSALRSLDGTLRLILWTQDINLALKAEMNGLETTNTSSLSRDPTTFLADIFTSSGLTLPARVQAPARSSPVTSPPGHPVYTSSSSDEPAMMKSMEIDIPSDSSNPFFMLFETLCQFLPSSLERHLCQISMINPAIILNAGLSSTDTTDWPVESCFEALRRIWGNEHGGWRGSDLGRILQSSESSLSPPHPSFSNDAASAWQTSSTTQSVHAPRKASSLSTQCLAEKDPSGSQTYTPPSASYVRTKILPTQVSFWTDIQTTGKPPSKGQWADIHSGLQILFGGQGGGRFIGPAGHRELQARLKDVRNALDG